MSGFAPDHPGAIVSPSPNFGPRRGGLVADMIILHYTGMPTGQEAEDWLRSPASEVSSHYLVHEEGRVVQMVREADRAWHAGKSSWLGCTDINSCSIGIEIVNPGHTLGYRAFPKRQVEAVIALCAGIAMRHTIPASRVLAHSDVAPGRKIDPGEKFPWKALADAGVGRWIRPSPLRTDGVVLQEGAEGESVRALQSMLRRYGYGLDETGAFGAETATVVAAFQRHFRPHLVDGRADRSTLATLRRLVASAA